MQGLETECFLVAGPAASLTPDAVVSISNTAKHFGRLFFIHFFRCENAVGADLHAPAAADAFAVVN
jgi:hypothetical protein